MVKFIILFALIPLIAIVSCQDGVKKIGCVGPLEKADVCCSYEPRLIPKLPHEACRAEFRDEEQTSPAPQTKKVLFVPFKASYKKKMKGKSGTTTNENNTKPKGYRARRSPGRNSGGDTKPMEMVNFQYKTNNNNNNNNIVKKSKKSGQVTQQEKDARNSPSAPCVIDCVFKSQSYYTNDAQVNATAVTAAFLKDLPQEWQPVVTKWVVICADDIKKYYDVDFDTRGPCRPMGKMFMTCIRQALILDCPQQHSNMNKQGCNESVAEVKQCNPYLPARMRAKPVATSVKLNKKKAMLGTKDEDYNINMMNSDMSPERKKNMRPAATGRRFMIYRFDEKQKQERKKLVSDFNANKTIAEQQADDEKDDEVENGKDMAGSGEDSDQGEDDNQDQGNDTKDEDD